MAIFTPPVVWSTGNNLEAGDLNANVEELQETINHGFSTAATIEDGSITSDRILRPKTNPIGDGVVSTYFQSGSIHRIHKPQLFWDGSSNLTAVPYSSAGFLPGPLSLASAGTSAFLPVPGVGISYYALETPLCVIVRICGQIIVPFDATGSRETDNRLFLRHVNADGLPYDDLGSTCRVQEMDSSASIISMRPFATSTIFTTADATLQQGWNHVQLTWGWSSNFGLIAGIDMTVEVLY